MITDRLCRPILFEVPEFLSELSAWNEHAPLAFWLVDALRPTTLVELGTHSGVSYCAFCQAIAYLHLPAQAYAVDTWKGDQHARTYGEDILRKLREHHDRRFGAFSTLLRASFDEASGQFGDSTVDLLHIDGYHTYDAVRHDFETWLPKMSAAGVVLFHDVAGRGSDFGVWRFWEEISARFPSFHFVHGGGLGIAAVGGQPPEPIRWLSGLAPSEIADLRDFFARRGAMVRELLERQRVGIELGNQLSRLNAREHELAASQRREADALRTIAAQAKDLAEASLRHTEDKVEIARMIERLGDAHRRMEELRHERNLVEVRGAETLANVYASTSWRVTEPLRALMRIVRGR